MSRFFRVGIEFGGFGNNTLTGGANRDYLFGGFGKDNLFGGGGRDFLFGGFGNDTLNGGAGSDKLFGGFGLDVATFEGSVSDYDITVGRAWGNGPARAKIASLDGSGDVDSTHGVEQLYFAADDYTVFLTGENNAVLARDDAAAADAASGALLSDLTANDFDFDGGPLTISSLDTSDLQGSASLNDDGTVSYSAEGTFDALAEGETATTTLRYTVTDGDGSEDTATVTITITGINDAPELSVADASIAENTTDVLQATATDVDGDTVMFTLSGDDAALFAIDASGALSFVDAPDFEAPADAGGDNVYDVTITATDAGGLSDSQAVQVTVTDETETPPARVWINEFHYDNVGGDVGEFIEIAGTAGADLTGWTLALYNGSNGTVYNTIDLAGILEDTAGGFGVNVSNLPSNGLQNGSPDGIALVDADGAVVEFISYEGTLTATNGPAEGQTSQDIGVAEAGSQVIGGSIQRIGIQDEFAWAVTGANTSGSVNTDQILGDVDPVVFVNEFHYDNAGGDVGEFIEVAGTPGTDLTGWTIVLYNGNGGAPYGNPIALDGTLTGSDGEGYLSVDVPGLQNGGPDGFALVNADGEVVEFLSYEGTFNAVGGSADGMTSTDIGVSEASSTEVGNSLQRQADGSWAEAAPNTRDAANDGGTTPTDITVSLNEFHYDNAGGDVGEFIEVAGTEGGDLTGWTVVLYNGNGGAPYNTLSLTGTLVGEDGTGYASVDAVGIQNGGPDGIALVNPDGEVIEFISYEGEMTATSGPAAGMTSVDVGVAETGTTEVGFSLQKQSDGTWAPPAAATRDAANDADIVDPPDGGEVLISEIQGAGDASALDGQNVSVTAVVTAVVANGFYLQEEDADADADAMTSEGIFVFTGDTPNVDISASYTVTGTVDEFFDFTQIAADTVTLVDPLAGLPTAVALTFPFSTSLEAVEGMQVEVTSGGDDPLTVIENFQLGRFGEVVLSEGIQINPTQLFDAQTELEEIQALLAENQANRLIIDDGNSSQNPTEIAYIANDTPGDNGNGIFDASDDFSQGGTLRIGAELDGAIKGVVSFSFGEFKIIPTETLSIDETTNGGAREPNAPDVGGDLKVVSFNALNYFTTLNERGATTEADLARQTEKLVNALVELDGDIVGLQEVENNGFGADSATAALVDALNERLGSEVYAYVDPTDDGAPIGTDAITTGFIYKIDSVDVVNSDFLIFDDGGQQRNRPAIAATFEDNDGERVTVAVNHFKSKGGTGTGDDADIGDGQGNFNGVRTDAAEQLTAWLATDPLGSGDPDVLIIGDLNAYLQEDPVQAIEAAGYDNLLEQFVGAEDAFSFVFDGQRGALDHALSTSSLTDQITGVAEWHINAEEPGLLGYSTEFNDPGFYSGTDPYAASDHDPLIVGLNLGGADEIVIG